ncbi:MAG: DUF432 domain-containing protein [Pseudomonadota bacterium]
MRRDEAKELKVFREDLKMEEDQTFYLRFGPLDLYIENSHNEIRLRWMTSNDWMDSSFRHEFPFEGKFPQNLLTEKRFAFSNQRPVIKISPCLGERAFVVKPDKTFMVLPGESAKIFMSTPMNLRLHDVLADRVIDEVPVLNRVKTWFGESPTDGELCFFTRIHAALIEENLPFRPHRALTQLIVENSSKRPLPIKQLKIPVNYLRLFQNEKGVFVTSSLSFRLTDGDQLKDLQILPPSDEKPHPVHEPREMIPKMFFKSVTEIMR